MEAHQILSGRGQTIDGVELETETTDFSTVTRTLIANENAAQKMGKAVGRYVTIQTDGLTGHDHELERDVSRLLAQEINAFLSSFRVEAGDGVLVVGLGNWNATPDDVGPQTISKLLVTRHLFEYSVLDDQLLAKMRPVAALSPGVLGLTGVESAEVVHAVIQKIQPAAVICVDALASKSVDRIGKTVQLSDAGINPGSGVGNVRQGLTEHTLGIPVLAVGVPTVIYATTIVTEALDTLLQEPTAAFPPVDPQLLLRGQQSGQTVSPSAIPSVPQDHAARQQFVRQVLGDSMGTLIVTPKEIDVLVDTISDVLADGLNDALHPGITAEEAAMLR